MKHNWLSDNLMLICAVIWYLLAVINFSNGRLSMAVTWFSLGSIYLCLQLIRWGKRRREKDQEQIRKMKDQQ